MNDSSCTQVLVHARNSADSSGRFVARDFGSGPQNNTIGAVRIVGSSDGIPPDLTVPGDIAQNTDAGLPSAVVTFAAPTATDNSGGAVTIAQTAGLPSGSAFPIGPTINTFTATDPSGNVETESFTVTVNDIEIPDLTVPSDITQNTDAGQPTAIVTFTAPTATDNSGGGVTIAQTAGPASGAAFPLGTTTVTFTATDPSGNVDTESFTVTVNDIEIPDLTVPSNITQNTDAGQPTAVVTFVTPTATDNSGGAVTIAQTAGPASGAAFPIGATTVTFTATDPSGNVDTESFTVTVNDTEIPDLTVPANITQNTDAGLPTAVVTFAAPTATDNSGGTVTIAQTAGPASGAAFPIGTTTVTFTATDPAGNVDTESFTVTVNDNENPVLTVPADITQNTDAGLATAVVTYTAPTATDNAPGVTIARTAGPASGTPFPIGITTVTHVATDAAGNTDTESFTVAVNDNEDPVLTVPADIVQSTDAGLATAVVTYAAPTATDNAPGVTIARTAGPASGSPFPIGVTTVTHIATDAAGNTDTESFTVTVNDNEDPILTVPADIVQNTDAGLPTAVVTYAAPTATDNAPGFTVMQTAGLPSGSAFPIGVTTNTFVVTDAAGNTDTESFTVTVGDSEDPILTVPGDIVQNTDAGLPTAVVTYAAPTASDNAPGVTIIRTAGPASGTAFPIGVTTVTHVATDAAGNTDTESFTVTVVDNEDPVLTIPADIVQNTDAGLPTAVVTYAVPTATDNAPGVTIMRTAGPASGSVFPIGVTTVTHVATDAAGNTDTESFTVTVNDAEDPVLTVPSDITQNTDAGLPTAVVTYAAPTATDNAPGVTIMRTAGPASGTAFPIGVTTVTHVATDAAGNTDTESFTVTVTDGEDPVLTVPADIAQNTDAGLATAVVTYAAPTATDNAPGVTIMRTAGPASGTAFPIGVTTVTHVATDAAGNTDTESFTVTISDAEDPVLTVSGDLNQNTDPGLSTAIVTYVAPTATDNAPGVTIMRTLGPASGSAFPIGVTTVTHVATDAAGNTDTESFTVTIVDAEDPVLTVSGNITQNTDPGVPTAVVTYPAPTATDNVPGVTIVRTVGPPSGSIFPIGTTTITHVATDVAGNTDTETFTVTVNDAEPPVISDVPADIVVAIDFPDTSVPVSFTPPTVSDNAPGATIVQTAGPAPGAAFPLGTTTVTYTATDASGNVVTASFTVTINQIPPGTVTIAVTSDVSDGTFNFSSPEPQFNFPVTTNDGAGQSSAIMIKPGAYVVTAALPDGFGLTGVTCSDNDSTTNVAGKAATINLQSGENVTCTFASADSRTKTSQAIGRFLKRRNDLLLQSEPSADRQIARLNRASGENGASENSGSAPSGGAAFGGEGDVAGGSSTGTSLQETSRAGGILGSGFGGVASGPTDPDAKALGGPRAGSLSLTASSGFSATFATSLGEMRQYGVAQEQQRLMGLLGKEKYAALGADQYVVGRGVSAFDIWVEGQFTSFDDDSEGAQASGHFGVIYLGADYVVSPQVLIGFLAQYDDTKETSPEQTTRISGQGWMIGPYATVKLTPNLYFQGRAAWGKSSNDISPFLTYTDNFDTERWLVRGKLQGYWNYGAWQFSPSASVAYIEDEQEAYTDSLDVLIPGQTVSLGQAEFGPTVSYSFASDNGFTIKPSLGLKGIWNFAEDNGAIVAGTAVGADDFRGKLEAGLSISSESGASLEFSGTYDGIGDDDFDAVSGSVKLRLPLN